MTTDEKLAAILAENGKTQCPKCGRRIDRGDIAWNNADTEAGTPFTCVEIQCQQCDTEIASFQSWWPGADSFDELVEDVLAKERF